MSNRAASYTERLKRKTKQIHAASPKLGWRDAKERARTYLHDLLNLYPSTPAIMKYYRYQQKLQVGAALSRMFGAFHAASATN